MIDLDVKEALDGRSILSVPLSLSQIGVEVFVKESYLIAAGRQFLVLLYEAHLIFIRIQNSTGGKCSTIEVRVQIQTLDAILASEGELYDDDGP